MIVLLIAAVGVIFLALFFFRKSQAPSPSNDINQVDSLPNLKKDLGQIQVFYASQTGTAAKMASTFAEESAEHGFKGIVIDLKNISKSEFQRNQISVFFMANTGEGEAPENAVSFMKMLAGKEDLEGETPEWKNMNFVVFGLGDTQYEHFNKIGIDTDSFLAKLGANRIHKIGLGDANSSLEDDYEEWKSQVWPLLTQFRLQNPLNIEHTQAHAPSSRKASVAELKYLNADAPIYANFKFCVIDSLEEGVEMAKDEMDFKTKARFLGKKSGIAGIVERRQDTKNGSSLQLQVSLPDLPEYPTAGNIALWPKSDPAIVKAVLNYFKLNPDTFLDIDIQDPNKKNKFNFAAPLSVQELLEDYLDLQFRVTKGLLKKLSKFKSKSSEYFLNNSSAKTTEEYKRISDNEFCYLFKLVEQFEVEITFEDFVELSDSVGPRLFTIASSYKAQKSIAVIASIVENGLISKHFNRFPESMLAELRKSSFSDFTQWKKIIFIGAGTGFAPFRGYLQEKEVLTKQGQQTPIISVYFGCKYSDSDFIYREEIKEWEKTEIINKLHLAFSRQGQKKVYVQDLLRREQEQLRQFLASQEEAMFICGALSMGKDVLKVVEDALLAEGMSEANIKQKLMEWQKKGKIIKELW